MAYTLTQLQSMRDHFLSLRRMVLEELNGAMPVGEERRRVLQLRTEVISEALVEIEEAIRKVD